ncbi:hypothetical protein Zmor_023095 [Zophobas morio]|uniref:Sodium-dependent multivitamin transporter n=1 Tax=Zophobas morio TaxID=2755281 RepID=A0AA38HY84_9CUCU|nr:hypothetical protein Zmor_023095 [Zophobas morio]
MTLNASSSVLTWHDYVIFIVTLAISSLIGIRFGCFGTRQATAREYLLAGKNMKILPIAVSIAVSHFSGILILGLPAEVHRYGASAWLLPVAYMVMGLLGVFVYLPVFFKLQLTNTYEYLERRFDRKTRILSFIFYMVTEILFYPMYVYTPALTFATASGVNVHLAAVVLSAVCIFYTAIGGLKTVLWTDIFQYGVIILSLTVICTVGFKLSEGFSSVWKAASDGQLLQTFDFSLDITVRHGCWGITLGQGIQLAAGIVVHQTGVQKYLALSKFVDSMWVVVCTSISMFFVATLCVFIGLLTYSKYKDCDPLTSRIISKHDQLLPYYVGEIAKNLPGVSGLLITTVSCASLSSMSSSLNALSAVVYKNLVYFFFKDTPSEKKAATILKLIVLIMGILCSLLVLIVDQLGEIISIFLL